MFFIIIWLVSAIVPLIELKRYEKMGYSTGNPIIITIGVLLLWIVMFPVYLIKIRGELKHFAIEDGKTPPHILPDPLAWIMYVVGIALVILSLQPGLMDNFLKQANTLNDAQSSSTIVKNQKTIDQDTLDADSQDTNDPAAVSSMENGSTDSPIWTVSDTSDPINDARVIKATALIESDPVFNAQVEMTCSSLSKDPGYQFTITTFDKYNFEAPVRTQPLSALQQAFNYEMSQSILFEDMVDHSVNSRTQVEGRIGNYPAFNFYSPNKFSNQIYFNYPIGEENSATSEGERHRLKEAYKMIKDSLAESDLYPAHWSLDPEDVPIISGKYKTGYVNLLDDKVTRFEYKTADKRDTLEWRIYLVFAVPENNEVLINSFNRSINYLQSLDYSNKHQQLVDAGNIFLRIPMTSGSLDLNIDLTAANLYAALGKCYAILGENANDKFIAAKSEYISKLQSALQKWEGEYKAFHNLQPFDWRFTLKKLDPSEHWSKSVYSYYEDLGGPLCSRDRKSGSLYREPKYTLHDNPIYDDNEWEKYCTGRHLHDSY